MIVYGHRGAAGLAPENTLAAFRLASELGVPWVELDVRVCASGELVVFHDGDLRRLTGEGGRAEDLSLAQLKRLDAGRSFAASFAGERIATLAEFFATVGGSMSVNVELKAEHRMDAVRVARAAVRFVRAEGLVPRVRLSSFSVLSLSVAHSLAPEIPLGVLIPRGRFVDWPAAAAPSFARLLGTRDLHPDVGLLDAPRMARYRRAGFRVAAWTVNDPGEMRRLKALGVDGIITDFPDVALRVEREPPQGDPA